MAAYDVDTDGVSETYASLNAALAALPDPFTESNTIALNASTGVKDTTSARSIVIDTTSGYSLTITGTADYIYSPSDAAWLEFSHAFGNYYNITIEDVNFEKPSMSANYQPILELDSMRDGDIIIKNNRFISDSGVTDRERLFVIDPNSAYNATVAVVNSYFRTKGSATHTASACIGHSDNVPVYMYNNTFVGYQANYLNASAALYTNNVIQTTVSGYTVDTNSDYNMFSGAFDLGGANDEQSQTFTFVNLGTDDVHLQSGDTGARGKGTDLSADGNFPFDYDQDGVTRSAWDAGAFEFVSAGGLSIPVAMHHYTKNIRSS